jgi:septal ring factor EnvC (AmiA/AmiB activator)
MALGTLKNWPARPARFAWRLRPAGLARRLRVLPFAVLALALCATAVRGQSGSLDDRIQSQKGKLQDIEAQIKKHRAETQKLSKKKTDVMKQLSYLDKEIALATRYLSELEKRERLLTQQIDSLRTNITVESDVLVRQKDKLAGRLRQMYMRGPDQQWVFVLGGENVSEKLRRYKFMRMIAERDAQLIQAVNERKQGLELEQAGLTEALADIAANKNKQVAEAEKLQKNKRTRVSMLNEIRKDETENQKAIARLEKSQEQLKDLIGQLERSREDPTGLPPGGFVKLKGRLQKPVSGKVIGTFGKSRHPTYGTVTFNNGIDIQAADGSPIRAVAAGRVEFVDWIDGYGNCIIINHGGGYYTLYAHASDIFVRPDQNVLGNEVIAEVGDTGSLHGYACHFEIRKSKQALDPMEWLAR